MYNDEFFYQVTNIHQLSLKEIRRTKLSDAEEEIS